MTDFTIDRALGDRRLLGAELGDAATWQTWHVALKAAFALPLSPKERKIFTAIAGKRGLPKRRVRELWCVVGRGGGKSRMAAALGDYFALFPKHRLARGEQGMVLILAASKEQAGVVFGYAEGFLQSSPALRKEIISTTRSEIRLRNNIAIAVHSNSFRTIRGRTLCAAIFDETAFWRDESTAMPDVETYTAVLPSLARTGGMLIGISTPYRKLGLLYQAPRSFWC
jgi:phage terminase large subunit-like protein